MFAPLLEVEAKGYPPRTEGDGLWSLSRPEVETDWRDLAGKPGHLAYAFALLELCDRTLHEAEPHDSVYDALTLALATLSQRDETHGAATLLWFLIRLVDELGYSVQYEICPRCQSPLVYPVGPFVAEAGGVLCLNCARVDRPMPETEWAALVAAAASDRPPAIAIAPQVRDVWLSRLLGHLSLHSDRPLQLESLRLFAES
jgi:recombinational DNA repair protein (RecF pathway)